MFYVTSHGDLQLIVLLGNITRLVKH